MILSSYFEQSKTDSKSASNSSEEKASEVRHGMPIQIARQLSPILPAGIDQAQVRSINFNLDPERSSEDVIKSVSIQQLACQMYEKK